MAGSVNKVVLVGNLGRDPDVLRGNSQKIAHLSIATSENWRDKNTRERKSRTEWHRVVIFNENIIEFAEQYLKKGSKVYIEGQLQTRKWQDQSGNDRYTTEVVLKNFGGVLQTLDPISNSESSTGTSDVGDRYAAIKGGSYDSSLDDDVPF